MRAILALAPLLPAVALLGACQSEPDFDDRYNQQATSLENKADQIEQQLNEQFNAAAVANQTGPEGPVPADGHTNLP